MSIERTPDSLRVLAEEKRNAARILMREAEDLEIEAEKIENNANLDRILEGTTPLAILYNDYWYYQGRVIKIIQTVEDGHEYRDPANAAQLSLDTALDLMEERGMNCPLDSAVPLDHGAKQILANLFGHPIEFYRFVSKQNNALMADLDSQENFYPQPSLPPLSAI